MNGSATTSDMAVDSLWELWKRTGSKDKVLRLMGQLLAGVPHGDNDTAGRIAHEWSHICQTHSMSTEHLYEQEFDWKDAVSTTFPRQRNRR